MEMLPLSTVDIAALPDCLCGCSHRDGGDEGGSSANDELLHCMVQMRRSDFTPGVSIDAVERGDKTAVAILGEAGTRIGTHLADLVNLFGPEIIVVGGEAVQFGDALLTPLRNTMELYLFFSRPELLADRVPSSWARGVAALATQSIFDFECSPSGSRDKHGCAVAMCLDSVEGTRTIDLAVSPLR